MLLAWFSKYREQLPHLLLPDRMCIVCIVSSVKSVCVKVGAEVWWGEGDLQNEWEDGSSPKLAEGPALIIVV